MPEPDTATDGEKQQPRFPQRDEQGRITLLTEMLAYCLLLVAIGVVMLAAIDGIFALLSLGSFGQISGWISGVLAVFMFVDDFRAHKSNPLRWGVTGLAAALAVAAGLGIFIQLPEFWLPLFNGALAVTAAAMLYSVLWYTGIRLLGADRE